jgi:hypothetical protein
MMKHMKAFNASFTTNTILKAPSLAGKSVKKVTVNEDGHLIKEDPLKPRNTQMYEPSMVSFTKVEESHAGEEKRSRRRPVKSLSRTQRSHRTDHGSLLESTTGMSASQMEQVH